MDAVDIIRLRRKRREIRDQVTFKYIAAYLLRDQIITNEDFQLITQCPTKQAQMDMLLDLLETRKSPAFELFTSALVEDYSWIADDLKNQTVSDKELREFGQETSEKDVNQNRIASLDVLEHQAINMDAIKILQKNARLVRRWSALAYRLGLDRQAQSIRVRVNINCEDLDQCVFYLMDEWTAARPKEANLANLIRALKAEEFNDVAVQLETSFS